MEWISPHYSLIKDHEEIWVLKIGIQKLNKTDNSSAVNLLQKHLRFSKFLATQTLRAALIISRARSRQQAKEEAAQ